MQPRRLAGVATTGVACRALAAGAAGVSAAWQPTGPGMYPLHQSLPPSSPAAAGSLVPQLGGYGTELIWGHVPSEGRARGQPAARSECGVGVGRSCRDPGAGVPWGSADSPHLVLDRDPDQDPRGSGSRLKWESLRGSIWLVREREEGAAKGRNVAHTHLSRDKLPGTRGEVPRSRCRSGELPVASDSRVPFPF